jgi:hypothetical protein
MIISQTFPFVPKIGLKVPKWPEIVAVWWGSHTCFNPCRVVFLTRRSSRLIPRINTTNMVAAKKSGRFPWGWIVLILVVVLLYSTNPSEPQFTSYLKDRIREQVKGDETMSGDLARLLSGPAASLAGLGTVRKDYFLCSTYELSLPGEEHLFLGIMDHFVKLK